MELLALVVIVALVFVFVGAVLGTIANSRTHELERRLAELERQLRGAPAPPKRRDDVVWPAPAPEPAPWSEPAPTPELAADEPPLTPAAAEAIERTDHEPPALPARSTPPPLPQQPPVTIAPASSIVDLGPPVAAPTSEGPPSSSSPFRSESPPPAAAAAPAKGPFEGVEQALGMRWLVWIGLGLLFLGIAFFLKYAYDRDWLGRLFGPRMRIATAAFGALALVGAGWRSLRGGMVGLGQALLGGGQALAYLTVYAALQPAVMVVEVPLLSAPMAFAVMVVITALGLLVAVRLDAIAMAFLAVLGGFATPVLVSSGQDARDALCSYLLLLDVGVLGAAFHRRWRALDLLAFAGTALLFGGWFGRWHAAHPQPDATLLWLAAFHLVFLLLPFAHHWRHRTAVAGERFALAIANVAWAYGYAGWMLHEVAPRLLAVGCALGGLLYLALGAAVARQVGDDRRTRDGFLVLAAVLCTLSLFHLLPVDAISTGWFVEAAALSWLGHRFANPAIRIVAGAVLTVAVLRTLGVHLPQPDSAADLVWNPWFAQLLVQSLGLGAFAWVQRAAAVDDDRRAVARVPGVLAGWWTLLAASLEVHRHANGHPAQWSPTALPLVVAWLQLFGVVAFVVCGRRLASRASFAAALLPMAVALLSIGAAYQRYPADAIVVWNGICGSGLAAVLVLAWLARSAPRIDGAATLVPMLAASAQLALSALATVEAAAWLQRGDQLPAAGVMEQVLGHVWLALAVGGGLVAWWSSSRRVLVLAMLPLALAVLMAAVAYGTPSEPYRLIVNQRFLFALGCTLAIAALGAVARAHVTKVAADRAPALALVMVLLFAALEAVGWSRANWRGSEAGPWALWLLGVAAVLGSAGGHWRARATANTSLRAVALLALVPALVVPIAGYLVSWPCERMFVNLRALSVAASIVIAVWWAAGDEALRPLRWVAFVIALLGLSAEPPVWLLDHAGSGPGEHAEAVRRALFAVTVTWVVVAIVMLVHGFRRDRRTVRLVALLLFAATAAKLLLLDMSGAQQLYRILAFVLVGLVFVAASWLYHRAERRAVRSG